MEGEEAPSREEIVALYDPNDDSGRVVGSAPRSRVRKENLPHAATAIFVRRPTGEFLVHRRADTKDLWPGRHDCAAGGVVSFGEDPDAGAVRELLEEVGITGAKPVPLGRMWFRDMDACYLGFIFEVVWDGPVSHPDGEVAESWWMGPDELRTKLADPSWPFVPDTRFFLAALKLP
ncbi:NUDIX-hydrolase-like protein [Hyaloraphidium curvatum]|nr:NUDIX-hydrolase-like protein [Hyaloraphidium curvatum]